jgi:hypothetical protein
VVVPPETVVVDVSVEVVAEKLRAVRVEVVVTSTTVEAVDVIVTVLGPVWLPVP